MTRRLAKVWRRRCQLKFLIWAFNIVSSNQRRIGFRIKGFPSSARNTCFAWPETRNCRSKAASAAEFKGMARPDPFLVFRSLILFPFKPTYPRQEKTAPSASCRYAKQSRIHSGIAPDSLRGKRDYATLAILLGCGLRRAELTALRIEDIQQREEHWVTADLVGKGGHIRTIPVPYWVKAGIDDWTGTSGITTGVLLRSINKAGRIWGTGFSPKVIWGVVKEKAKACEIPSLAPHDLRRTCARLCHQAGGELDQIQFLLGHISVQTTERYLGCMQRFRNAVNDRIGLEPNLDTPKSPVCLPSLRG